MPWIERKPAASCVGRGRVYASLEPPNLSKRMVQDRRHNEDDELGCAETDRRTIGASLGTVDTFVNRSNRFARNSLYSSSL